MPVKLGPYNLTQQLNTSAPPVLIYGAGFLTSGVKGVICSNLTNPGIFHLDINLQSPFPAPLKIKSTSVNDGSGTNWGINAVRVKGLIYDNDTGEFRIEEELVYMQGTNARELEKYYSRVISVEGAIAGQTQSADGTISVYTSDEEDPPTVVTYLEIQPGRASSNAAYAYIPAKKILAIHAIHFGSAPRTNGSAHFSICQIDRSDYLRKQIFEYITNGSGTVRFEKPLYVTLGLNFTEVVCEATMDGGNGYASILMECSFIDYPNPST